MMRTDTWRTLCAFIRYNLGLRANRRDWRRVPRPVWAAKRGGVEVW